MTLASNKTVMVCSDTGIEIGRRPHPRGAAETGDLAEQLVERNRGEGEPDHGTGKGEQGHGKGAVFAPFSCHGVPLRPLFGRLPFHYRDFLVGMEWGG